MAQTRKNEKLKKKKHFSSFTYTEAFKHLNLEELRPWHFEPLPLEPSAFFQERLARLTEVFDLQSYEESKKLLIDAICEEAIYGFKALKVWKGAQLADDTTSGYVDYLVARQKRYLEAPFVCVVEAKKDDFEQGLAQCLVEMKACQFNNRSIAASRPLEKTGMVDVIGIVTNGGGWQFYRLREDGTVDESELFSTGNMADLLGRLRYLFDLCDRQISGSRVHEYPAIEIAATQTKSAVAD
jgi:hypothetical protein